MSVTEFLSNKDFASLLDVLPDDAGHPLVEDAKAAYSALVARCEELTRERDEAREGRDHNRRAGDR